MARRGAGGKAGKAGKKAGGKGGRFKVIDGGAAAGKAKETAARVGEHTLISATALKSLLRDDGVIKEKIDTLTGELRNEIKQAVDKKGLDKTAYAMMKRLYRMTPEKAASIYANFLAYVDMSGLAKDMDAVGNLPLETDAKRAAAEGGEGEGEDEEAGEADTAAAGDQQFGQASTVPH